MKRKGVVTTLKARADFLALKEKGRSIAPNSWMILRFSPNSVGRVRLGCTFPRYVGTAVTRNRLRRWSKEFFRQYEKEHLATGTDGFDVNVILKARDKDFYKNVEYAEFMGLLKRAMETRKRGKR